jgi:hypothetical protein
MSDDRILLSALLKLHTAGTLPASQCTPSQRKQLDLFARQTRAISCQRQGRGDVYRIVDAALFSHHVRAASPGLDSSQHHEMPLRAQHIADARNSKAGKSQHDRYYLLLKAVGSSVNWREVYRGTELALTQATENYGVASLAVEQEDDWQTEQDLWLVENQALFSQTNWLPRGTQASIVYYAGQLNGVLVDWLKSRSRARNVIHFPDYDGVGLANFVRLHQALDGNCAFWLMPDWSAKLAKFGNRQLWRDTLREFTQAQPKLPDYLLPLAQQMNASGMALEQEAIWL